MRFPCLLILASPLLALAETESEHRIEHFWRNECATCHAVNGQGIDEIKAPAIAGLPDYYVMQQIEKFKSGMRGVDPDDKNVSFMHEEATELDEELFRELAKLIAGLEPRKTVHSVIGDIERGNVLYKRHCETCHGPAAAGNAAKEIPPLYGFQDWYLVDQIERFRRGKRKADPYNVETVKMHAMAKSLWRQRDVNALAAFIATRLEGETDGEP
ncbi:MAG: c-type cytochrome [Verrucomicrobiota bacterium]